MSSDNKQVHFVHNRPSFDNLKSLVYNKTGNKCHIEDNTGIRENPALLIGKILHLLMWQLTHGVIKNIIDSLATNRGRLDMTCNRFKLKERYIYSHKKYITHNKLTQNTYVK